MIKSRSNSDTYRRSSRLIYCCYVSVNAPSHTQELDRGLAKPSTLKTLEEMANLSIIIFIIFISLISLLPILTHSFSPENPTDRRILVLLDDWSLKSSHSIFFQSLQTRGFELDFNLAEDPDITLQRYGQYLYDALVLFCPTADRKLYMELRI